MSRWWWPKVLPPTILCCNGPQLLGTPAAHGRVKGLRRYIPHWWKTTMLQSLELLGGEHYGGWRVFGKGHNILRARPHIYPELANSNLRRRLFELAIVLTDGGRSCYLNLNEHVHCLLFVKALQQGAVVKFWFVININTNAINELYVVVNELKIQQRLKMR